LNESVALERADIAILRAKDAYLAYTRALRIFNPAPETLASVHPSAVIHETADIALNVEIMANVVIGANCKIAENVKIFPNATIYPRTQIGARVRIHAAAVIGSDGFGYVFDSGAHRKIPQVGNVIIKDDAEIGAGVTIDRGALGATEIGKGAKIDNLVQIAHNVVIGDHCIVISQAGIAGSSKIGAYTVIAGQAGIAGHLNIGSKVTITAQSGVMHDIPDGEKWFGYPAQRDREMKRQLVALRQLPDLLRRIAELEKQLATAREEGRQLIRSQIAILQRKLESERARQPEEE